MFLKGRLGRVTVNGCLLKGERLYFLAFWGVHLFKMGAYSKVGVFLNKYSNCP